MVIIAVGFFAAKYSIFSMAPTELPEATRLRSTSNQFGRSSRSFSFSISETKPSIRSC